MTKAQIEAVREYLYEPLYVAPVAIPSAIQPSLLTEVCDALFGCFLSPAGEGRFVCGCCEVQIDVPNWIHADHDAGCIIPRVREYLREHKPEALGHHNGGRADRPTD